MKPSGFTRERLTLRFTPDVQAYGLAGLGFVTKAGVSVGEEKCGREGGGVAGWTAG